jgi:hypothetical protein
MAETNVKPVVILQPPKQPPKKQAKLADLEAALANAKK